MRLNHATKGKVRITMPKHIEGILEAMAEDMDGVAETPESNHLLQVIKYGGMLTTVQDNVY